MSGLKFPTDSSVWNPGSTPVAIIMITLNEAHNMEAVLDNLEGWAAEVYLVDSYSSDATIDLALARGVNVVQRGFCGFGDQWNYAVSQLPIEAPWTMKLDPDERLTPELKASISSVIAGGGCDKIAVRRRLWFMGRPLPIRQTILRIWRTGSCRFTDVDVNEHPIADGRERLVAGDLEHHDSPNLHHWFGKQNSYSTREAIAAFRGDKLAASPRPFGSRLERRMWMKSIYMRMPLRHQIMFCYCYFWLGAWQAGRIGFIWSRLRAEVFRMREYKRLEMELHGRTYEFAPERGGAPDHRVQQADAADPQRNKQGVLAGDRS